jgi:pantoate--beta-alanine ligase
MKTVRTVAEVRAHVRSARAEGRTIGLVPTMGAFHEGHLALIRAACAACDEVVVWLFVNPSQFNDPADLETYPRDEARDAALAAREGADVLFAPTVDEVYPEGFATTVTVHGLGDVLEGAHRPGHFGGVATVVTKMLNMVAPDAAFFGQKDAQQVALVMRLARDLDIPARIEIVPTVREPDGLAMSSRNVRLSPEDRRRATALARGLRAAAESGERDPAALERIARTQMDGIDVEYVAVVDPDTFLPVERVNGRALVAAAARVGSTRLIDNMTLGANP